MMFKINIIIQTDTLLPYRQNMWNNICCLSLFSLSLFDNVLHFVYHIISFYDFAVIWNV